MTIEDITNDSNFLIGSNDETIIKVIGVGGGGNNAIKHMYNQGIKNVSFVVCNTDKQALDHSPVPNRVLIGPNITKGLNYVTGSYGKCVRCLFWAPIITVKPNTLY